MAITKRAVRTAVLVLGLLGSAVLIQMGPLSAHGSASVVTNTGTGGSNRSIGLPLLPAV